MTNEIRRRNWLFTINNPEQSEQELLEYLKNLPHAKYGCFGREKGDGTENNPSGTEHFQGYIEFSEPKNFTTVKGYFSEPNIKPSAHLDPRKGTKAQARDYVFKVNEYADKAHTKMGETYEFGKFADSGDRSDLTDIMDDIEQGFDEVDLSRKHHGRYARHQSWADRYKQQVFAKKFGKIRRLDLEVVYIYGKTGLGKTRHIMDTYGDENVYRITNYDGNLFDNYNNESVIIFEEFRSQVRIDIMLNYLDVYPLRLPARYNNKIACYTKAFIVTNIPLSAQYKNVQTEHPETWAAFLRRIHKVYNFDLSKDAPVDKTTGALIGAKKTLLELVPIEDDGSLPF
ncbi:MAG: hypothetical protein FWD58_06595 [Firmicutes bacterium]|nr:hypothetical protein [Bacillota bacterium]